MKKNTARGKTHDFSRVPSANIPRSVFDRSFGHKTSFDSGVLFPIFCDEALPGDTYHVTTQALCRLSTPIVPIMDNMKLDIHYFSVPKRLVWDNWQKFMGERKNPGDSVDFLVPQVKTGVDGFKTGTCADYFGLPTNVKNLSVSALPFRAYELIYNEWYRDQNLIDSAEFETGDEDVTIDGLDLRRRAKRHDYFTSSLPWPQKGAGVELSLGVPNIQYGRPIELDDPNSATNYTMNSAADGNLFVHTSFGQHAGIAFADLGIDLLPSSALTINTMRQAFQIQKMLERDARGGTRYVEIIRSHFGVISPDARQQRPEYLGMSSFDINVNPVVQNSSTDANSPQGNLAAYGVAGGSQNGFSHSFTEHSIIIGIASVRADLTYQQGINRMWSRKTRFDYYWPSLAHLGEQAVLSKEIYADGTADDDSVFGYQERYAEYRYKPSIITGKLRSTDPQSLDVWHLAQKFDDRPLLNQTFIEENAPLERALAVQDEPQFIGDFFFKMRCVRPMPTYSVPGLIDHF